MDEQIQEKMTETDAQKEKEEAARKKKQERKEFIEFAQGVFSLSGKALMVFSLLLIYLYCFFEEIALDGLSVSDVLFFGYVVFGFCFVIVVGTLTGAMSMLWFVKVIEWISRKYGDARIKLPSSLDTLWFLIPSGLSLALFLLMMYANKEKAYDMDVPGIVLLFMIWGFLALFVSSAKKEHLPTQNRWAFYLAMLTISFLIPVMLKPTLLNFTMGRLGVRSLPNQTIIVSAADHDRFTSLARLNQLKIEFCQLPGTQQWATQDIRVIWHGIGATSFIRLLDQGTKGDKNLLLSLPRTDVHIVRARNAKFGCTPESPSRSESNEPSFSPRAGVTGEKNP